MTKKKTDHSRMGGSSMGRVIECPGSYHLCKGLPSETTPEALEGSFAHRVAEKALKDGRDPMWYVGRECMLETGHITTVTEEMALFVKVYTDMVRSLAAEVDGEISIEEPVHLDWLHQEFWGTCDAVIRPTFDTTLYVIDFKFGRGVNVDAEDNTQLKFYALGGLGRPVKGRPDTWQHVKVGICQPRGFNPAGPIRWSEPMPVDELREWSVNVLQAAAKEAVKKDAPVKTGEHCRWCRAKLICPAIAEEIGEIEQVMLDNPMMTPEHVARMLELRARVENYFKAVWKVGLGMARTGQPIPGYKLVEGRTDRKWREGAEDTLGMMLGDALYDRKMKSPAQTELLCKQLGLDKKVLTDLIEKPAGMLTLAPVTDTRGEKTTLTTSEIFEGE